MPPAPAPCSHLAESQETGRLVRERAHEAVAIGGAVQAHREALAGGVGHAVRVEDDDARHVLPVQPAGEEVHHENAGRDEQATPVEPTKDYVKGRGALGLRDDCEVDRA